MEESQPDRASIRTGATTKPSVQCYPLSFGHEKIDQSKQDNQSLASSLAFKIEVNEWNIFIVDSADQ